MGLFGGFKAKFSRDPPRKASRKNEVICVGYRIRSEFEDLPQSSHTAAIKPSTVNLPSTSHSTQNVNTLSTESLSLSGPSSNSITTSQKPTTKNVAPIPKLTTKEPKELSNAIQLNGNQNASKLDNDAILTLKSDTTKTAYLEEKTSSFKPSVKKDTKKNVAPIPKPNTKEPKELSNSIQLNRNQNVNDAKLTLKSDPTKTAYLEGKTSSFKPSVKKDTKSILKQPPRPPPPPLPIRNDELTSRSDNVIESSTTESKNDNNYHFAFTKHSKENGNILKSSGSINASRFVMENNTAEVATFVRTELTESTVTNDYSAPPPPIAQGYGQTSSQAASIFFDGDDEPVLEQRPRRINMKTDDRRSSADC